MLVTKTQAIRAVAAILLLALAPWPALAHAILLDSVPAASQVLKPGRSTLDLHYNSRIDVARSRVTLAGPDKAVKILPITPGDSPDHLAAVIETVPGAYALHWQVLAVDGHITRGELRFTVAPAGN